MCDSCVTLGMILLSYKKRRGRSSGIGGRYMKETMEELKLEELELATGGMSYQRSGEINTQHYCEHCKKITNFIVYSGARGRCKECGNRQDV